MIRKITPWETDTLIKLGFDETYRGNDGCEFQRRIPEVSGTMTIHFAFDDYDGFGQGNHRWSGKMEVPGHNLHLSERQDLMEFFKRAYDAASHFIYDENPIEWIHPHNWKKYGIDISSKARAIPPECIEKPSKEQGKSMTRAELVELLIRNFKADEKACFLVNNDRNGQEWRIKIKANATDNRK